MGPVGIYWIVADDHQNGVYLVIEVIVDGPARVVGTWDERKDAQADADRWMALEL
jgi:hypothetical protein